LYVTKHKTVLASLVYAVTQCVAMCACLATPIALLLATMQLSQLQCKVMTVTVYCGVNVVARATESAKPVALHVYSDTD